MKNESELYNDIYREIAELLGEDTAKKIYQHLKGQQIFFPIRLYDPELIKQRIVREYDGTNITQLTRKYGYSEKTIRRIIKAGT